MGLVDALRDMFVPNENPGIQYECANCGERFETPRGECPVCGSTEIAAVGSFDVRPDR